nr:MAG: hypothetical protein [Bacteriophage sp.]
MALYREGKAAMAADGTVNGTGTKWQSSLSLIRPGATIMFLSSPIQMAVVNKVVSDTEIKAITTNGAVVASTDYAILLSDSLTVDGLAQDVAETLRYYQSQEAVIADAVEFFKEFDFESLQNLANQIKADSEAAESSAAAAAASESKAKTSEDNAKSSENAAKNSEVAAETARDQVQQIIDDAGEQSTLVVLAQDDGYSKIGGTPAIPFSKYLAISASVNDAFIAAAASGKTIVFTGTEYEISQNDIPFARYSNFVGPDGGYVTFKITNATGTYGTFDLRTGNGLGGGRYNTFRNIAFRYPNQVTNIDGENITAPIAYPPIFHGGAYESRFEKLDIGNAYYGFRLGGALNGVDLGTASRLTLKDIIGAPLYRGLSLEQVRDVPIIDNMRWNYNYLDGGVYAYNSTLKQWIHDNAWGFHFGRVDWATVRNIFCYGYSRGIVLLSSRYTGSADRLKFVGCFIDHTVNPIYLQNFQNQVDFIGCGFTGDYGSEFTRVSPSNIYISDVVGDAWANFSNVTMNNFTGHAIRTGANTRFSSCSRVWDFGYDSSASAVRNGVEVTKEGVTIAIENSIIDASSGSHTRCAYDGGFDNSNLFVSSGSQLIGATTEIFRWNGGVSNREMITPDCIIEGSTAGINARGSISFYTPKNTYLATSMPTTGTYRRGEFVKNTTPSILGEAGAKYVLKGWTRITDGNAHVLNTDWVEERAPTGA